MVAISEPEWMMYAVSKKRNKCGYVQFKDALPELHFETIVSVERIASRNVCVVTTAGDD